jgi:hypothetical protein
MAIENAQLKNIQTDIFGALTNVGVPQGKRYAITSILVTNTYDPGASDASLRTARFDMHFRKANQPLENAVTCVVRQLELPAGETFSFSGEKVVLDAGEEISFVAEPGVYILSGMDSSSDDSSSLVLTDLAVCISYLEV